MNENTKNSKLQSVVRVSSDRLNAFLNLCPPEDKEYTLEDINNLLNKNKVVYGIKKDKIKEILEKKIYCSEVLIAEGLEPVSGKDGKFEFLFNTEIYDKPKILEDGSVDYRQMNKLEIVEDGQEIVRYIPATKGSDGIDVHGGIIVARPGKNLQPLRGKGFNISEDKTIYTAIGNGKIEYSNGYINVLDVIQIQGDVDYNTGEIVFTGDVLVQGNVLLGTRIKTKGNINVDGHVEGAELVAGKDIILKNGMQGGGKGYIEAGGSVSGKFFEQVNIKAKGSVNANAIMNCNIECEDEIIVSGKRGVIVGGVINAIKGVKATIIGNMSEIKTVMNVGVAENMAVCILKTDEEIKEINEEILKMEKAIKTIDNLNDDSMLKKYSEKKMMLIRNKITKVSEMNKKIEYKEQQVKLFEKSLNAEIKVEKAIYPRTQININGGILKIDENKGRCTIVKKGVDVEIIE